MTLALRVGGNITVLGQRQDFMAHDTELFGMILSCCGAFNTGQVNVVFCMGCR
jgi:hypothetical protein